MITHVVFFWVDEPVEEKVERLLAASETLKTIPVVKDFVVGTSVKSPRGVVCDSFALGMSITFDNMNDVATYVKHPDHVAFVTNHVKPLCARYVVHDIES